MRIFRAELYKIASRKLIYVGLLGGLLFLFFYFQTSVLGDEVVYEDGKVYRTETAIEKDKAIAEKYEGSLTREKAEAIIAEYGWTIRADDLNVDPETGNAQKGYFQNGCNSFITNNMSVKRWDEASPDRLITEEDAPNIAQEMNGTLNFGYVGGWGDDFREMHMMLLLLVSILAIIAAAPVFAEEYSMKTVDVLKTTQYGKGRDAWIKAAAAMCFGAFLYLLLTGLMLLRFIAVYGIEPLSVSAELGFSDAAMFMGKSAGTIGGLLSRYLLVGLASLLASVGVTLYISSRVRQSFQALILGIVVYLLPYVLIIVLQMMRFSRIVMGLFKLVRSFPALVPLFEFEYPPGFYFFKIFRYLLIGALIGIGMAAGCRRYNRN